ncbi:(2Fe-2S)-binding protein [Bordetella sp. N]|uniref:(2Fe-2S)-binding protein n=1 Tax=Bordetella sp. N TaxID=1746199 RepID=UPI00070E4502|nr:(2Fe-2S)-binding protein [Bordetella sp. N]ALM83329.1 sarcosine oxidase subunit alpha [Bordetella sp. N]
MFKPIDSRAARQLPTVAIHIDGRAVRVAAGQPLATALLAEDALPLRYTAVSGAPRAPLCLMGVCFECLVEVDGRRNVQSCMVEVREGMQVRRLNGAPRAGGMV